MQQVERGNMDRSLPDRSAALSPRQRECLRLVWDRQATSKEIAVELGISKSTVDGYIQEAALQLGARDRREAAALAFGGAPRAALGGDPARVAEDTATVAVVGTSNEVPGATRPWRTRQRPRNTLSLTQTIGWIALIAIGSLFALSLATIIGNGLPPVARSVQGSFGRSTR